ncbi:adenosine deaminase [Paenibacillus anaericanus]|uniref:hypothetical protein n=1 Tax=Paenibacillus anaericanus TaxID=170367 RepID=UPI00278917E5|nr:hypothetical protein [Paenibacillus anaericanus]MDQ0088101.1 adenosine deaminase [Paenibacillus anaericanus]
MTDSFISALENNNIDLLRQAPKSDLHNHAARGGNRKYIEVWSKTSIVEPPKFESLNAMQHWYDTHVKSLCIGKAGFVIRIEAAFQQALDDGIQLLCMSFGTGDKVHYNGSLKEFIDAIHNIHLAIAPQIEFIPEICYPRTNDIYAVEEEFEELLSHDYFKSIDIVGDDTQSLDNFKNIYQKARDHNFILKAHVGEFGDAESVIHAVNMLGLDQIQHGINSVYSDYVMEQLVERDIQLNICPSSNVMLCRVSDYKSHPIRQLFDKGVKVTINSDDMLIFDQSVSDDYMTLYKTGLFTAEELNIIRLQGLNLI